jgi:hypothetical protein
MPIRHTWTLLLLLVVALAPASARQEQLCHELISALQSEAAVSGSTDVADEQGARRFFSGLIYRNAGAFFAALGHSGLLDDLRFDERIDWIEMEAGESIWKSEPQVEMLNSRPRATWRASVAEVEWCREFLAEP